MLQVAQFATEERRKAAQCTRPAVQPRSREKLLKAPGTTPHGQLRVKMSTCVLRSARSSASTVSLMTRRHRTVHVHRGPSLRTETCSVLTSWEQCHGHVNDLCACRGISVYSALPLQRTSFGHTAEARMSGLTLHPSGASVPMPAQKHQVTHRRLSRSSAAGWHKPCHGEVSLMRVNVV